MEPTKLTMPPLVHLTYARKGENFFGRAEIPTANGKVRFAVLIPLADIKGEVARYLAAKAPEISGDPNIIANLPRVIQSIAKNRAKRRLGTAIKLRYGGNVKPYEVAGPAGFAHRMAKAAANKAAKRKQPWGRDVAGEVGWSLWGGVKAVGKGIGKGVKAVGKGTVAVAKGVGKGTVAVAKGVGKGAKATGKGVLKVGNVVTKNPLTRALVSVVPGGAAAIAVADAARGGSPGAQAAIAETNAIAQQTGDPIATRSAAALNQAYAGAKSNTGMIVGVGAGTLGVLFLLSKKRR